MISLAAFGQRCAPVIFPQDRFVAGFPKALDKGLARGLRTCNMQGHSCAFNLDLDIWVYSNEGVWGIVKIDSL